MGTATEVATATPAQALKTRSARESELQTRLTDLCAQAARCVVASDEDAEKATTLGVAIKNAVKAFDDDRKTLVGPLNGVVKDINERYKRLCEPADAALTNLTGPAGQLTKWNTEKRRVADEAARKAREEAEAARLAEAERLAEEARRLAAEGDKEAAAIAEQQAEESLQAAIEVPAEVKTPTTVTRGIYGGSSGTAKVGKFRIADMAKLLEWELANVKSGKGLTFVMTNDVELGRIARMDAKKAKPDVPGVEWYSEDVSRLRG